LTHLLEGIIIETLIPPAVIQKIAELKGISADEVEQATTENTIRLFHLPIHET
jgi:Tat protein secretion system quality control protein TatD with DNase activity